jgi:hypothetical protein
MGGGVTVAGGPGVLAAACAGNPESPPTLYFHVYTFILDILNSIFSLNLEVHTQECEVLSSTNRPIFSSRDDLSRCALYCTSLPGNAGLSY